MAKPRVFVSSTYYDLKYIRASLEQFISSVGYEPILFEKGDIPFQHDKLLEEACLSEIGSADVLILIVGGRYGSLSVEDREIAKSNPDELFSKVRSITEKEYEKARQKDIPIFIFVVNSVYSEYHTYKQNKGNKEIQYAHVDDVRIFELVDSIVAQRRNNFIKPFENVDEITGWLRDQWAGLFCDFLRKKSERADIENIKSQVDQLSAVVKSIQNYSEELIKVAIKNDSSKIIERERERILVRAEEEMAKSFLISDYLLMHNEVGEAFKTSFEKNRSEALNILVKSPNLKTFLKAMELSDHQIEMATLGVESQLGRDFQKLRQQLVDLIT